MLGNVIGIEDNKVLVKLSVDLANLDSQKLYFHIMSYVSIYVLGYVIYFICDLQM